jgi:hypothetical protein
LLMAQSTPQQRQLYIPLNPRPHLQCPACLSTAPSPF